MNIVKIIKKQQVVYRDEPSSDADDNERNYSIINLKSFDYKVHFMENGVTQNNLAKNNVKILVPLKYLGNFWRSSKIPLIVK